MVYRDYWAFGIWLAHYGAMVGERNLYVVAHGHDPKLIEMAGEANVITIPRDTLEAFDSRRSRVLNGLQASLSNVFDWVIRTDVDELIAVDPEVHNSVPEALAKCGRDAVFALGCDLVAHDGGHSVVFTGHYSKAFAVTDDVRLFRHGVKVRQRLVSRYPFQMPRGIYLVHLKYANMDALLASNDHRRVVANGEEKGLPGRAWAEADARADLFLRKVAALPQVEWREARDTAFDALASDPMRDVSQSVIRARSLRFSVRCLAPGWFPVVG